MPRFGDRLNSLLSVRVRPALGSAVGLSMVVVTVVTFGLVHDSSARVIEALVMVVPVVAAAVLGGQRAAVFVAVVGTLAFGLIIPPFGSPRVELTQDVVALVVFLAVALAVGSVVARRVEALGHLEEQRELLMRSVSHDFRTPLAVISAATSDLMQSPHYDDATRAKLQSIVLDETDRLDRLVANLLDLSRLRSGQLEPHRQAVDVGELVDHVTQRLRRVLVGVDLRVELEPGLPALQADFTQMDQVLTNLLENAVRHSSPTGVVGLTVVTTSSSVRFSVTDEGPGVDPDEAEVIFQPFRSGALPGSSGVGLAICRGIVQAHGGTIRVTGRDGPGAEFVVDLPYR